MNKSPAFQFYVRDWMTDPNLMLIDWESRGMHMHLLCISWFQDLPGTLPNDNVQLMKYLGISTSKNSSIKRFENKLKAEVLVNFRLDENPISPTYNRWVHDGLVAELKKQKEYKEGRSKNAKKRWNKQAMNSICTADEEHVQRSSSATSSAIDEDIKNISSSNTNLENLSVDLPSWIKKEDWLSFVEHRKSLKAPLSDLAKNKAILELKKLNDLGFKSADVINQSIVNGWKGLFPLNKSQVGNHHGHRRKSNAEIHFDSCKESLKGTNYDPEYNPKEDPFGAEIS